MNTRTHQYPIRKRNRLVITVFMSASMALAIMTTASAQQQQQEMKPAPGLTTLMTETPEEGFALAVKLSQKGVATTQTDADIRKNLRPVYAHDPDSLIAVSHVIATHFQTIAAANDYWRDR